MPPIGSIVYIAEHDVWLAAPDGSQRRQVTTDGTEADPYHDPSQADDGTIVAIKGADALHRYARDGRAIGDVVRLIALENGAEGLVISPAGDRVYATTGTGVEIDPRFGTPTGIYLYGGTRFPLPFHCARSPGRERYLWMRPASSGPGIRGDRERRGGR